MGETIIELLKTEWGKITLSVVVFVALLLFFAGKYAIQAAILVRNNDIQQINEKIINLEEQESLKLENICTRIDGNFQRVIERIDKLEENVNRRLDKLEE